MKQRIKKKDKGLESLVDTLSLLNYKDESDAAAEIMLLEVAAKYSEFTEECRRFEERYGMKFSEFNRVMEKQGEENFRKEEDLMAWKFAWDGMGFWKKKLAEIKNALSIT